VSCAFVPDPLERNLEGLRHQQRDREAGLSPPGKDLCEIPTNDPALAGEPFVFSPLLFLKLPDGIEIQHSALDNKSAIGGQLTDDRQVIRRRTVSSLFRILVKNIKRILEAREWSYRDLADKAGIAQATIARYLGPQEVEPGLDAIDAMAKALGVTAAQLLTDPDSPAAKPLVVELSDMEILDRARAIYVRAQRDDAKPPPKRRK
jgi:transcriptional regulator with XRE-family HTH domain